MPRLSVLLQLEDAVSATDAAAPYTAMPHVQVLMVRLDGSAASPSLEANVLPVSTDRVVELGPVSDHAAAVAAAVRASRADWLVLPAAGTTVPPSTLTAFAKLIAASSARTPIVGRYLSSGETNPDTPDRPAPATRSTAQDFIYPLLAACAGHWSPAAPVCLPVDEARAILDASVTTRGPSAFALALQVTDRAGTVRHVPTATAVAAPTGADERTRARADAGLALDHFLEGRSFETLVPPAYADDVPRLLEAAKIALTLSVDLAATVHAGVGASSVVLEQLRAWMQRRPTPSQRAALAAAAVELATRFVTPPAVDASLRALDRAEPFAVPPRPLRVAREQARAVGMRDAVTARHLAQWLAASSEGVPDSAGSDLMPQYRRPTRVNLFRALDEALHAGGDVPALLSRGGDLFPDDPMWQELTALFEARGPQALRTRLGFTRPWHLHAIPRIAHFYWGGERTSFLRYMSVASFRRANPDWEVRVHVPRSVHRRVAGWTTTEAYEGSTFHGRDYSRDLFALSDVDLVEVDFDRWPAMAGAAETFKADFFRWHILATEGGLYSDADIAYHRPVRSAAFNAPDHAEARVGLCAHHGHQFIGFLLGAPGAACYQTILREVPRAFDPDVYQSIGSHLLQRFVPTVDALAAAYPDDRPFNVGMDVVYAFDWLQIDALHAPGDPKTLPPGAIGIHWYGGAGKSQRYNERVTHDTVGHHQSLLDQYVARIASVLPSPPGRRRFPTRTHGAVRFSVLVPSYQQAHYLPATLDSVLAQTWDDFEVVVVDDGSTDETREVIAEYMARDRRIRGFTQANGGAGAALNTALAHARGDRICWLSSDDLYEPEALATFADAQGIWPHARFFHANFSLLHEAEHRLVGMPDRRQLSALPTPAEQTLSLLRANFVNGITICIDRALVLEAGGWDTRYRWAQDFDLWLRLSLRTPLQYVDARVARTRLHAGQDTSKFPMAGMWDSARAVHALLARHDFSALTPFADLENDDGTVRAASAVATALCDPNSFLHHGVGPNVVLLGHTAAWAVGQRRRQHIVQALCRTLAASATAPSVVRDVAAVLQTDPAALGRAPVDALAEMTRNVATGAFGELTDELRRYLEHVARFRNVSTPSVQPIAARRRAS